MELLFVLPILVPVAALMWVLHRSPEDPVDPEPPTLDVQNHVGDSRPLTEAEFVRRWGRITGG